MVLAIPLPFLDYHPLMQPVTKAVAHQYKCKIRVFWMLVICQLLSSIVNFCIYPTVNAFLLPVAPLWGIQAVRTMIPMHFFVLFFLGMPMDVYVGFNFIARMHRPDFGFNRFGVESPQSPLTFLSDKATQAVEVKRSDPEGSAGDGIEGSRKEMRMRTSKSGKAVLDSSVTAEDLYRRRSSVPPARKVRLSELTVTETITLINSLGYAILGASYCILGWYFYRKLGEVVTEGVREPLLLAQQASEDVDGRASGDSADHDPNNPLFAMPALHLQESSPVLPFAGGGQRLGSLG